MIIQGLLSGGVGIHPASGASSLAWSASQPLCSHKHRYEER